MPSIFASLTVCLCRILYPDGQGTTGLSLYAIRCRPTLRSNYVVPQTSVKGLGFASILLSLCYRHVEAFVITFFGATLQKDGEYLRAMFFQSSPLPPSSLAVKMKIDVQVRAAIDCCRLLFAIVSLLLSDPDGRH